MRVNGCRDDERAAVPDNLRAKLNAQYHYQTNRQTDVWQLDWENTEMEQGEQQVETLAEACALCRQGEPVRWAGYRLRWVHGCGVQLTTSCAANHLRPEPQVTVEDAGERVGGRA